jgi:hypothetical protein
MIKIISPDGNQKIFRNYHEVCDYISNIENQRPLEPREKRWSFLRRRYQTLSLLYDRNPLLKDFLTPKEKEAAEKGIGLIEIIKGNREHITQLLLLRPLDIEPLKRDWCKEYGIEHDFEIFEGELK